MGGHGGDSRPARAPLDLSALLDAGAEELTLAGSEAAPHRRVYCGSGIARIDPPDRPEARLDVESTDRDTAIGAARSLQKVVVHIGVAAWSPVNTRSVEFIPGGAADEPALQPTVMDIPTPDEKIPVVQVMELRSSVRGTGQYLRTGDQRESAAGDQSRGGRAAPCWRSTDLSHGRTFLGIVRHV